MFENVGKKLQLFAKIDFYVCIALIAFYEITTLPDLDKDLIPIHLIYLCLYILGAFCSALLLYGFGQLIDDVSEIRKNNPSESRINPTNAGSANNPYSAQVDILRNRLHKGLITPEQYNQAVEKLKQSNHN